MRHPVDADRAFHAYLDRSQPEDLAAVFDALAPKLLLLANHVAGRPGAAEDLVQATFLRAIEIAPRFERGRPVLPWLTGILVLEAKKARRADARVPDPGRLATPEVVGPAAAAELDELREALESAIAELPDAYAEVLALRLVHGLTPTEIAHALRLSPETVKTRIRRGGERLRTKLPAGFAAALGLLATPARSLSAVRDAVLATLDATAPLATATPATAATVATTRNAVLGWAAAGTAVVTGALVAWQLTGEQGAPDEPLRRTPVVVERNDDPIPSRRTDVATTAAEEIESTPPVAPPVYSSIEGRFRDARGPVAGVRVTLLRVHADALITEYLPLPHSLERPPFVAGEAETDVGGRFVIEQVPPGGLWLLRVDPPNRPPFVDLVAIRQAPSQRVDLGWRRLAQHRFGYARLIEPNARAIPSARIYAAPRPWSAPDDWGLAGTLLECWTDPLAQPDALIAVPGPHGIETLSVPPWLVALRREIDQPTILADGRGDFVWRAVGRSEVNVVIDADGFAPKQKTLRLEFDGHDHGDVILEPLPDTMFTVVDAFGDRVADAEVAVGIADRPNRPVALRRVGRTDGDGVIVAPFPAVALVVAVRATPEVPFTATRLDAGPTHVVRLPARHVVKLRCVERSGVLIEDVEVRLLPGLTEDTGGLGTLALHQLGCIEPLELDGLLTDSAPGEITIDGVPGGPWTAIVTSPDRTPAVVSMTVSGPTEARVELAPAEELHVTIVNQGFEPLRGVALVAAAVTDERVTHPFGTTIGRSDADAIVTFDRRRHTPIGVAIAAPGLGWRTAQIDPGGEELQVVLREQGEIAGVLASAAESFDPREFLVVARRVRKPWDVVPAPPVIIAPEPDGRVAIGDLEPGDYRLHARPMPGPIGEIGALLDLLFENEIEDDRPEMIAEVTPGTATTIGFDPIPPPTAEEQEAGPTTFVGQLLVDGAPPSGGMVVLTRDGSDMRLPLDETGSFDAGEQAPGTVELALEIAGLDGPIELWRASVPIDDEPAPLAVDVNTSPISAQVTTASGERATGVAIELTGSAFTDPTGSVHRSLRTDAAGFVAVDQLPDGRFTVRVTDPQHGWLRMGRFEVGPTQVTTGLSIELRPLLRFTGDLDERALDVAVPRTSELEFERIDDDGVALTHVAICQEGGGFTAERLLPGRYRVTLRAALRMERAEGGYVLVDPSLSGIVVPLADLDVPEHDVAGATLAQRR